MAELGLASATNFLSFAISSITGNVMGTLYTMIGVIVSSFNALGIMLKYLAVKTLTLTLTKRQEFTRQLLLEVESTIRVLQILANIKSTSKSIIKADITRSLEQVKQAALLVNLEYNKFLKTGPGTKVLNELNLNRAVLSIDESIQTLVGLDVRPEGLIESVNSFRLKHGLKPTKFVKDKKGNTILAGTAINPIKVGNLLEEVLLDYWRKLDPEYVQGGKVTLSEVSARNAVDFTIELLSMPGIPMFFKEATATLLMGSRINVLGLRLPVPAIALRVLGQKAIGKTLGTLSTNTKYLERAEIASELDPLDIDSSFINIIRTLKEEIPQGPAGDFSSLGALNLTSASTLLEGTQVVILSLEANIKELKVFSNQLLNRLRPIKKILDEVKEGMSDHLEADSVGIAETSAKKLS